MSNVSIFDFRQDDTNEEVLEKSVNILLPCEFISIDQTTPFLETHPYMEKSKSQWEKLPICLRELPQWVVAGKDKIPLKADRNKASVIDASTWCDFDTACKVAQDNGLGIGFVITKDDPFTCIDIDIVDQESQSAKGQVIDSSKWTSEDDFDRYRSIIKNFNSYTEISLNGQGIHIWVKGNIGSGMRRDSIEVYSQERYMVCTGNTLMDLPIADAQVFLDNMQLQMKPQIVKADLEELPETLSDNGIFNLAINAANADKFNNLCKGDWSALGYPSQSEADLALMSMFTFYSPSNEQCRRLFRMTALGTRDKAVNNNTYLNRTLNAARSGSKVNVEQHSQNSNDDKNSAKNENDSSFNEQNTHNTESKVPKQEPELLRAPIPKTTPYPVDALGPILGAAATALHETIKAPLTLCCQSVLASASLAAQSHFDVLLPWGEKKPLTLFLLTVAESGERKSGVDDVVLRAAKVQERQDMEVFADEQELYEAELSRWKEISNTANKATAKLTTSPAESDYTNKHSYPDKPEPPIMPLRFVTDPTVEGLYKLMVISQPSLGLFSDEAGLLIGGHALNSDNALKTMARWCKLWDGASFDRVRAGDGSGVLYGRRLAMHQLAQPDVMALLLGDRMANGQGFLARCLVAWPESTIGSRQIDVFKQPFLRNEIINLSAKLKELSETEPRMGKNKQELDPLELPLNKDAEVMAVSAMNQFETLMECGGDLSELRDRASKALENACRIAGVLTVIEQGMTAREIGAEHLERALMIVNWYLQEALRIRGSAVVTQSVCDAESLSKWLHLKDYKVFRTTPILKNGPNQLRNKNRLIDAIKELVDNGYLFQNEQNTMIDGVIARKSWRVLHTVDIH
jgi:hypothetical protein